MIVNVYMCYCNSAIVQKEVIEDRGAYCISCRTPFKLIETGEMGR